MADERSMSENSGKLPGRLLKNTPMMLCSHLTGIQFGTKAPRKDLALLEEISLGNGVVTLGCPLRKGTAVRIDCAGCELHGKVTDCRKESDGYRAEVKFVHGQGWQPGRFKPDGLFNPRSMQCERPGCGRDCVAAPCVPKSEGRTV